MEEAQEILMRSLDKAGVILPRGVSSTRDLTQPHLLFSICSQSLRLIHDSIITYNHNIGNDNEDDWFMMMSKIVPKSMPESMTERVKLCNQLASSINSLGYSPLLSFHEFLYPSDEDSHKLVRFLVEKLSQVSEGRQPSRDETTTTSLRNERVCDIGNEKHDNLAVDQNHQTVTSQLKSLRTGNEDNQSGQTDKQLVAEASGGSGYPESCQTIEASIKHDTHLLEESKRLPIIDLSENEASVPQSSEGYSGELRQKLASLQEKSAKTRLKIKDFKEQGRMLTKKLSEKTLEVKQLDEEHSLLKASFEMAFDDEHSSEFYVEKLKNQVQARRNTLLELESQWDALKQTLIEGEQDLRVQNEETQEKLLELEKVKLEIKVIESEIIKREEECSKLSAELKNQPKIASRKSYIERITEITKNSRKQDSDIERILQETRLLQLESNSIQDRLHRTYTVVDETVFRDSKNDPTRRQAYRLLTSLHSSFEEIADKILATDRVRRELTDLEAKLAGMRSHSFDIDKLEMDLNELQKENDLLEQQIQHK